MQYVFCEIKPSNSGLGRPLGLQEVEPPRISRQSAYEVGKVLSPTHWQPLPPPPPKKMHFSFRLSWPKGHSVARRIRSVKNPNDPIGNWTHDLLACSTVPLCTPVSDTVNYPPNYTESHPTFSNVSENLTYYSIWCYWQNSSLQIWQRNCLGQKQSLYTFNTSNRMSTER